MPGINFSPFKTLLSYSCHLFFFLNNLPFSSLWRPNALGDICVNQKPAWRIHKRIETDYSFSLEWKIHPLYEIHSLLRKRDAWHLFIYSSPSFNSIKGLRLRNMYKLNEFLRIRKDNWKKKTLKNKVVWQHRY